MFCILKIFCNFLKFDNFTVSFTPKNGSEITKNFYYIFLYILKYMYSLNALQLFPVSTVSVIKGPGLILLFVQYWSIVDTDCLMGTFSCTEEPMREM